MSFWKGFLVAACLAVLSVAIPDGRVSAQDTCNCRHVQEFEWAVEVWFATGIPHRQIFRLWAFTAREAEEVAERLFGNTHPRRNDSINAVARRA